jgi:uncharacterized damage-inducible protein DinB
MSELSLAMEWYRYNARVRDLYLKAILKLEKKERLRDRGASFPSVQDVFVHILDAYRWWFKCVADNDTASYERLRLENLTPNEIKKAVKDTNSLVFGYLRGLKERDLGRTITASYEDNGKKGVIKIKVRDMIWHMVEEELQHRGELNALLWQMDVDPPVTGWDG